MPLKPWPTDVVIILCERKGSERPMKRDYATAICRDCKLDVAVDPVSILVAGVDPSRGRRKIDFLCTPCGTQYEYHTIHVLRQPGDFLMSMGNETPQVWRPRGFPAYARHPTREGYVICNFRGCGHVGKNGLPVEMECGGKDCKDDCPCCQLLAGAEVYGSRIV